MIQESLTDWQQATTHQKWGVQQAIKTTLELTKSGDIKLCFGADVSQGVPCLINAISFMLSETEVNPSGNYPAIVRSFDCVNSDLKDSNVNNQGGRVSSLAAEILLKNMGTLKPIPETAVQVTPDDVQSFMEGLDVSEEGQKLMQEVMENDTA